MIFADKIVMRHLADLIPYAKNSRTHNRRQIAQIAGSMREFGFTNPILIDGSNGIVAGHGRVMAAEKLGLIEVPCIELDHLTPTQRQAYVIADNKLALNAEWDEELLSLELDALRADGFDLELTGFALDEIKGLGNDGEADEDEDTGAKLGEGLSYQIVIECGDETHQAQLIEDFTGRGLKCRPLIL
jgi:ParB-like chromosome segregation protein Spo0J